jgi:hypothetical protein
VNETTTLRARFGQVLTIVVAVIIAAGLVSFVVVGDFDGLARYGAGMLLIAWTAWVLFWSPAVIIDPAGVVIRNLVREHRVTWPAIQRIDTKFALELFTTAGKFTAWAAPAPSRVSSSRAARGEFKGLPESTYGAGGSIRPGDLPSSESGQASLLVRLRWEALRDAGHLDSAAVEGSGVVTSPLWTNIIVLAVLITASLVSFAF